MEIRYNIHREIVYEATIKNMINNQNSEGVLLLENPIEVGDYVVQSVCCETGNLVSNEDKLIGYQNLSIEVLSVIHQELVKGKRYTFVPDRQLVS